MSTAMANLIPIDTTALQKKVEPTTSALLSRANALAQKPLTLTTVTLAQELDTEAKNWLEAWEREHRETREALFQAHRKFTAFCNKMADGPKNARLVCKRLIGTWELEQQRKAREEAERQRREAEAAAAAAKKAEVDTVLAEAAATGDEALLAEAEQIEATPILPTMVTPAPVPKLAGASITMKKTGRVVDIAKLLRYLLVPLDSGTLFSPRLDLIAELIEVKQGSLDRCINRGLDLPGVAVSQSPVVRNLGRE